MYLWFSEFYLLLGLFRSASFAYEVLNYYTGTTSFQQDRAAVSVLPTNWVAVKSSERILAASSIKQKAD